MNLTQISKKYGISESFLNSKEDALSVASESLKDIQNQLKDNQPRNNVINRIQYVIDFLMDVKNSSL